MKRTFKRVLIVILLLLILLLTGFIIWGSTPLAPSPTALDAMQSDESVSVVQVSGWTVFQPGSGASGSVLIIYPGGRVDYRAYAPLARRIALEGHLVVLVPMPLNLAVLGVNKADAVIDAFPQIDRWAVGGHSLGGAMAASYAHNHPGRVKGLVLWASYPAQNNSLAEREIRVVSVYGTRDGLTTLDKIEASRPLLPPDTTWVPIDGGNHAQFGAYGSQPGDLEAEIDAQSQLDLASGAAITLLQGMSSIE